MSVCSRTYPVGVCSWSFQKGIDEIASIMDAMDVSHIHLSLAEALEANGEAYLESVKQKGWTITSTMLGFAHEDYSTLETIRKTGGIVPDERWAFCLDAFKGAAKLTADLGVPYLSLHAGFLDMTDSAYANKFLDRMRTLADCAADNGISLLMETGQESADELLVFIERLNHDHVFLNFDPANLILYNKDEPLKALPKLIPWIRHIHIKDAVRTSVPGTWGTEVPWGAGEVNAFVFLNTLEQLGYQGPLAIEREAGNQRVKDIASAVKRLQAW